MDGREIDDVEAHRLGVVDPRQAIAKGRAAIAAALGRAREKIHTRRRCARLTRSTVTRGGGAVLRGAGAIGISRHQNFEFAGMRDAR